MDKKTFDIFLAVYFSDIKKIEKDIVNQSDIDLLFEIPNDYSFCGPEIFRFSIIDIFQMNLDCWYSLKEKDHLKSTKLISPKKFYQDTLNCFNTLLKRFPEIDYQGVEYDKYINLIMTFYDDDDWINQKEILEFETEGYRRIDLDLINYGVRRNIKKVVKLLEQGANPMIDPDDKISDSEILDILGTAAGFHFISVENTHLKKLKRGYKSFNINDSAYLMAELYGVASSEKLYNIIETHLNKAKGNPTN